MYYSSTYLVYFFLFSYFFVTKKKKKMTTPHIILKREGVDTSPHFCEHHLGASLFHGLSQWQLHWGCWELSFSLDFQWPIIYPCFLYDIFVWFFMSCIICIIFCLKLPCWLLKAFPNCHSVYHENNKYACTFLNIWW